ncbi:MAG: glycosyltransferase [Muricomes sp.]
MNDNILYINTDEGKPRTMQNSLLENRRGMAESQRSQTGTKVTVVVVAYNRIDKTKRCVESILQYTKDIDYNLLLIDNGSDDETLEYFASISFAKKKIIKISKNMEVLQPFLYLEFRDIGDYMVFVQNDIVVTENWLKNMLICAESDISIGMVVPMSSNTSNGQQVSIEFSSQQQMQKKAAEFNRSNPKDWQERLRLITIAPLFRKETLFAIGFPLLDPAFFHNFCDDDVTFRVRRAGYKAILLGDTWVHHDHPVKLKPQKELDALQQSLEVDRHIFRDKWNGIDAWDDVNNFCFDILEYIEPSNIKDAKILGIDVRCGTPALDIKNHLRKYEIWDAEISAFTQQDRYVADLKTISSGIVACDREEFIKDYFLESHFNYSIIGKPINQYHEPQKIIQDVFSLTKKGGFIIISLLNPLGVPEFLNILGQREVYNPQFSLNIPLEVLYKELEKIGTVKFCQARTGKVSQGDIEALKALLAGCVPEDRVEECLMRLTAEEFVIGIEKR